MSPCGDSSESSSSSASASSDSSSQSSSVSDSESEEGEAAPSFETDGSTTSSSETCQSSAGKGGRLLWELCCSPQSRLAASWMKRGFEAERFAPETGSDLSLDNVGRHLAGSVPKLRPHRCWVSVPCTYYSIMQNLRKRTRHGDKKLAMQRQWTRRIVAQCLRVSREVVRYGGHCYFEWPRRCTGWRLRLLRVFETWLRKKGQPVHKVKIDGCRYGLRNPQSGKLLQKPWTIMTTDPEMTKMEATCSKQHRDTEAHEVIQGSRVTASTSFYPMEMVDRITYLWQQSDTD